MTSNNELESELELIGMLIARDDLEKWDYQHLVLDEKIEYILSGRKPSVITKLKWRLFRVFGT